MCRVTSAWTTGPHRGATASARPGRRGRGPRSGTDASEKTDSQAAGLRKGSRGGRPPGFDEDRCQNRNTVEPAVNKLKNSRAVAARYDCADGGAVSAVV
jgi:hypothetical protein